MNSTRPHSKTVELLLDTPLAPYVPAFTQYLAEHGYSSHSSASYVRAIAHFGRWMRQSGLDIHHVDEEVVRQFLDEHLPCCHCARPVHRTRTDLSSALRHLLTVLRNEAVIAEPQPEMTPVDEELRRFDNHMNNVRGLSPKTRTQYRRTVRRLLLEQFGHQPIVISSITPEALRRFIASQRTLYRTSAGAASLLSALRSYFYFRTACGDPVHGLLGVAAYPANWQLASLPKGLCRADVERLVNALGGNYPSARRTDAIVRCALDLGLRCGEIAGLRLDDIDWHTGTLTLRRTKGRRTAVLPLPDATGHAIVDYLMLERPQTTSRAVFLRSLAPLDRPLGSDGVRKTIRRAYARAGLPYTRSHLLRHTLASRLLEGGSSLKEVADVLRHRSLNTTLIYAKLDSRNLSAVALPWPGDTL